MLALELHRLSEALRPPGADLDLRGDQLSGRRLGQQLVLQAGGVEVLEAVAQVEALGIDDRELLLEPDREVGRGLEQLPGPLEVEVTCVLGVVRATSARGPGHRATTLASGRVRQYGRICGRDH